MIFFDATRPVSVARQWIRQALVPRNDTAAGEVPCGYVTSMHDFVDLRRRASAEGQDDALRVVEEDLVLSTPGAPVELGVSYRGEALPQGPRGPEGAGETGAARIEDQIGALSGLDAPRTAIINGFGTGIGDYVVGLTAWRVVRRRMLEAGCAEVGTEIWARTHGVPRARVACPSEPSITRIRALPVACEDFLALDGYWDLSGLLDRPSFKRLPTVDFFLQTLGVDPSAVAPEEKRNRVLIPADVQRQVDAALAQLRGPFVLLHAVSSTPLRDMPAPVVRSLLGEFARSCEHRIASLHPLPAGSGDYVDLSGLFKSHQHFCAVIARAAGILTVDTSTYHVADAFDVPTLVLFTTVPPERWVTYYPTVDGMMLDGARESRAFGMHVSNDPAMIGEVQRLWHAVDLPALVERFLGLIDGRT